MKQLSILIADDEAPIRFAFKYLLRHVPLYRCLRVLEASNGFEALDVLDQEHQAGHDVDILMVDMLMPGCTGGEIVGKLAAGGQRPCIICMTGSLVTLPQFPVGIFPYLVTLMKPFGASDLMKHLSQAIAILQGGEGRGTFSVSTSADGGGLEGRNESEHAKGRRHDG